MWAAATSANGPGSFLRGWRYYLEVSSASFAVGRTNVVQMELAHA